MTGHPRPLSITVGRVLPSLSSQRHGIVLPASLQAVAGHPRPPSVVAGRGHPCLPNIAAIIVLPASSPASSPQCLHSQLQPTPSSTSDVFQFCHLFHFNSMIAFSNLQITLEDLKAFLYLLAQCFLVVFVQWLGDLLGRVWIAGCALLWGRDTAMWDGIWPFYWDGDSRGGCWGCGV